MQKCNTNHTGIQRRYSGGFSPYIYLECPENDCVNFLNFFYKNLHAVLHLYDEGPTFDSSTHFSPSGAYWIEIKPHEIILKCSWYFTQISELTWYIQELISSLQTRNTSLKFVHNNVSCLNFININFVNNLVFYSNIRTNSNIMFINFILWFILTLFPYYIKYLNALET